MDNTFKATIALFKADIERRLTLEGKPLNGWQVGTSLLRRGVISVLIYRLKRYFLLKQSKPLNMLAWLLKFPEFHFCHNEIDPRAEIGPGLVLNDLGGIALSYANIIGKNCTFMGKATPTLGAMENIDIDIDRIRIGDYCTIGPNVRIINPVTIANGTQIKANSVVMVSVKVEGSLLSGFPARTIAVLPLASVMAWSPLLSKYQITASVTA